MEVWEPGKAVASIPAADETTVDDALKNPPRGDDSSNHVEHMDDNRSTDLAHEFQPE